MHALLFKNVLINVKIAHETCLFELGCSTPLNVSILITTDGTLFVAEYNVDGVSLPSRIIRKNLRTGQTTDLFSTGDSIYDIALLGDNLLFLEFHNGIKAVSRYASGPVSNAQVVATTGLESCSAFMGLHVERGKYCTNVFGILAFRIT